MPHNVSLISTIAAGFGLAMIFGYIAARIKVPPLVGYLFAGILIGPATPGFVADVDLAGQLAEIGVMLLMLGVGLHFSLADLLAVKRIDPRRADPDRGGDAARHGHRDVVGLELRCGAGVRAGA